MAKQELFIVSKNAYNGLYVRAIFELSPQYDGRDAQGNTILKPCYRLRRRATTMNNELPDHELFWHSVRTGSNVYPFQRWEDELPAGAVPFKGKLPRVGVDGMFKNREEATA